MLISRMSRRISNGTVGRPQRRRDFQRQYNLKPARCHWITVSGRTIASASCTFGNSRQTLANISLSIGMKWGRLGRVRRSTLICCRNTSISASSATRDRSRSMTITKISLHKSNFERQHRPILDQPPADWIYDRDRRRSRCDASAHFGSRLEICSFTQEVCATLPCFLKRLSKPFQALSRLLISSRSFAFSSVTRSPQPSQANCVSS
jgi:hypothetical protein